MSMLEYDMTTYVAVHDQDIIILAEQLGWYDCFSNLVWLFLGPRPCDAAVSNYPVIRCMDYAPDNPNLYDFAGFRVLVENNLIQTKYSTFLQYDHWVEDDRAEHVLSEALHDNVGMVSFVPAGYDPGNWMLQVPNFVENFHRATRACGSTADWTTLDTAVWPTTQGHAWRSSYFYTFMKWSEPGLREIQDEQYAGHLAERLLAVYCTLTHPPQYATGLFVHTSKDVHGTGALMGGDLHTFHERNAVFGKTSALQLRSGG